MMMAVTKNDKLINRTTRRVIRRQVVLPRTVLHQMKIVTSTVMITVSVTVTITVMMKWMMMKMNSLVSNKND